MVARSRAQFESDDCGSDAGASSSGRSISSATSHATSNSEGGIEGELNAAAPTGKLTAKTLSSLAPAPKKRRRSSKLTDEERARKAMQRKMNNRKSAAESRIRKLEYYRELEASHESMRARLAALETENKALKAALEARDDTFDLKTRAIDSDNKAIGPLQQEEVIEQKGKDGLSDFEQVLIDEIHEMDVSLVGHVLDCLGGLEAEDDKLAWNGDQVSQMGIERAESTDLAMVKEAKCRASLILPKKVITLVRTHAMQKGFKAQLRSRFLQSSISERISKLSSAERHKVLQFFQHHHIMLTLLCKFATVLISKV